jgi:hypothetical protein
MPDVNHDRVDFNTGLFGLRLSGPNSLIIFLFIALLCVGALTVWATRESSKEHQEIVCMIKLNLYVNSIPRGEPLDWSKMPVDLYGCVPRFLYERTNNR